MRLITRLASLSCTHKKRAIRYDSLRCEAIVVKQFLRMGAWLAACANTFHFLSDIKKGLSVRIALSSNGTWQCATLTWGNPTLPSPLIRFTSEFGMESGGTVSLWLPGKTFSAES